VSTNIAIFALAAFFEIAGCFAFWLWIRGRAAPGVVLLGIASLIGFALALARTDSAFAGRSYAAYLHAPHEEEDLDFVGRAE
jgi:small multidrug resistance family-3 protein